MNEDKEDRDRESRDSLDIINNAIIKNTFLGYMEEEHSVEPVTNKPKVNEKSLKPIPNKKVEKVEKEDSYCCPDDCFKWWFFHSSFQISGESIIEEDLLNRPNRFYCCDICSDCIELKLKNCCPESQCTKEYCSNCFYNGFKVKCCCFTVVLTSK